MKATKYYFPVVPFIMLQKVILSVAIQMETAFVVVCTCRMEFGMFMQFRTFAFCEWKV